jgi:homoserine kinase
VSFVQRSRRVSVPATSANLGPGYDCLGLALELRDELTAEVSGRGLVVEVTGEGADSVPRDAAHLVVRAMAAAFTAMDLEVPPLRLSCLNRIPHARGLGSSSAAIVGGIALARALVADESARLDLGDWLSLANGLEGHPDNVAPALFGGLVVCGQDAEDVWAEPAPLDPRISAVAFVPPTGLSTELARGLLPASVPHFDAVANTGRAALLVATLGSSPEGLLRATEDFLHQAYRRSAMPDSLDLVDRLRSEGHPAVVSGAGPTVLVLRADEGDLSAYTPEGWRCLPLAVAPEGVRALPQPAAGS